MSDLPPGYDRWRTANPYNENPQGSKRSDCTTCGGSGLVSDRHPNDPDCVDIPCPDCGEEEEPPERELE